MFISFSLLGKLAVSSQCEQWRRKNLGIWEATKDRRGASSKNRQKKTGFVGRIWRSFQNGMALLRRCDAISLQMQPSKDADPELGHSFCLSVSSNIKVSVKHSWCLLANLSVWLVVAGVFWAVYTCPLCTDWQYIQTLIFWETTLNKTEDFELFFSYSYVFAIFYSFWHIAVLVSCLFLPLFTLYNGCVLRNCQLARVYDVTQ